LKPQSSIELAFKAHLPVNPQEGRNSGYNPKSQLVTQALHKRDILQTDISFLGILIIEVADSLYALMTMIELIGPVAGQQGALYVSY